MAERAKKMNKKQTRLETRRNLETALTIRENRQIADMAMKFPEVAHGRRQQLMRLMTRAKRKKEKAIKRLLKILEMENRRMKAANEFGHFAIFPLE